METLLQEIITSNNVNKLLTNKNIKELISLKDYLDDLYYNTDTPGTTDHIYDLVNDYLLSESQTVKVGHQLRLSDIYRIPLPFWVGSMDKVKDDKSFEKWVGKNKYTSYLIGEKLDGVSALLTVKDYKYTLYTRGDGNIGSDISHIIAHINGIPLELEDINVRGELIVKKSDFLKYKNSYSNPRNMVSGIVNAKTARIGINAVNFIAYEIVKDGIADSPSSQLKTLKDKKFNTVHHSLEKYIDIDTLTNILTNRKVTSDYNIDGLVIQPNREYVRNTSGNPEYMTAFKVNSEEETALVEVIDVEWNISMRNMIKPKVKVTPVYLSGVVISSVTGFNAKFIVDNNIGKKAVIRIVRSGDVIPHILEVVKVGEKHSLPSIPFEWNKSNVDIIAKEEGKTVHIKSIHHFLTTLDIKQVALSTLGKLYDIGITTIPKLVKCEKKDFLKVDGIKDKSASRIYNNIHSKLTNVPLYVLMAASGIFGIGIGIKKLKVLTDNISNVVTFFNENGKKFYSSVLDLEGYSEITAKKVIIGMPLFIRFLEETKGFIILENKQEKELEKILLGKKYVFSGFRDMELEKYVEDRGGSVTTAVTSKTTGIIVKVKGQETSKITKARRMGLDIDTVEEFKQKYH